ncbi:MAG TPA: NAD(P)/FAD-dependent oxidoreductase [Polyangiaceae bacterium]|nr:NAD(P)/FAD-dependent oxidoreductase [Polyangiaceae bacterium]
MRESGQSIVIVGTGFAGLCMAIRLKKAGIHDFALLEQADEVGGTWRDNRYPGAACDVESHLYSFSFEPNSGWTRRFAPAGEIFGYLLRCVDKYGLREHIRFRATVVGARFDEAAGRWVIETSDGEVLQARVLVSACGGLSRPAVPDIAGMSTFRGKVFHSARWDHSLSLEGKRVAVVGTGASAIQIVPAIAPQVSHLAVYQRTAPWILPRADSAIGNRARSVFRRFPAVQRCIRWAIYWRREALALGFVVAPWILKTIGEPLGRRHIARNVEDVAFRAKMLPSYPMGCKRILLASDYYDAVQRDNVEVVTEAIGRIIPDGIVTVDGAQRRADAIVLATGFRASDPRPPFELRGREGRLLEDIWRDGAQAYLGTTVSGFPNFFILTGPNTGLGHSSMILMIESQAAYVLDAVRTMRARGVKSVDVRSTAQARYNERLQARLGKTVWAAGCRSWYLTPSGRNTTLWPGFTFEYRLRTARFDPRNYDLTS